MSTTSNSDLIATYELYLLATRAAYAAAALMCFEHLITFKYEIDFLRKRKRSAATWIFVFNRYLLLASVMFQVVPAVPQICNNSHAMRTLSVILGGEIISLPIHVFSILRTFALLQNHSWRRPAIWILIALALTTVALGSCVEFTQTWTYVDDPILGPSCFANGPSAPLAIISRVDKAGSAISIVSASIVLGIALLKTARQVHQSSMLGLKTTLSEVLLRDGILFFLLILLQDLYATIYPLNVSFFNSALSYAVAPFFNVLPLILLSRFIINLRQIDSPGTDTSANQHQSRFSMPNFRMPTVNDVVGNLGELLDFDVEHRLDDEDDAPEGSTNATVDMELQYANVAGPSSVTGVVDIEAAGLSGSNRGSVDANVLDIDDIDLAEPRLSAIPPV